jgi:hypothetical protein
MGLFRPVAGQLDFFKNESRIFEFRYGFKNEARIFEFRYGFSSLFEDYGHLILLK